jgi:hypothetical protein
MDTMMNERDKFMTNTEREVLMYGTTLAELRESVEDSLSFRFQGPAMVAASMMSDAQEMMAYFSPTARTVEEQRQLLNRAKWVLFTYVLDAKE